LCSVQDGNAPATPEGSRPELAKLIFKHVADWDDNLPTCATRLEALSSVLVYVLVIDPSEEDATVLSFKSQLDCLVQAVEHFRSQTRAKLRPVRAALLCYLGRDPEGNDPGWVSTLADHEQAHGHLWKFGPWHLQDSSAWYASFAEMASSRISEVSRNTGDTNNDRADEEDRNEEEPEDTEGWLAPYDSQATDEEEGAPLMGKVLSRHSVNSSMSSDSLFSAGWLAPPVFEVERTWSSGTNDLEDAACIMKSNVPRRL
jgi:hypothetical protein